MSFPEIPQSLFAAGPIWRGQVGEEIASNRMLTCQVADKFEGLAHRDALARAGKQSDRRRPI